MKLLLQGFVGADSGTAAIEYALVAAGIFLAIIVVVGQVGSELLGLYADLAERMSE